MSFEGPAARQTVQDGLAELVALVDAEMPKRFYRLELLRRRNRWRLAVAALIARMADMCDSISVLTETRRDSDVRTLVRSLYEHVVVLAWLGTDPERKYEDWLNDARSQRRTVHEKSLVFGIEVLSKEELDDLKHVDRLRSLERRAEEADKYWAPQIRGWAGTTADGKPDIRTLPGLYIAIYRVGSRSVHGSAESIEPCLDASMYPRRPISVRRESTEDVTWAGLAIPIFCHALLVCHELVGWPKTEAVRDLNDGMEEALKR